MSAAGAAAWVTPLHRARAVAFYLLAAVWTVLLGIPYTALFLFPRRVMQNCGAFYSRGLLVLLRLTTGIRHEVRGLDRLPPPPYILAAKHQSAWETLALPTILRRPAIVLKRSLYRIPVFGWYLKASGQIGIDRNAGASALRQMIADARRAAAEGRPIVIFPEGTRTAPGEARAFHVGISALYDKLRLPVVPVALNSGLYWPRESSAKHPGRIVIEFLPALPADLARKALMVRLHEAINVASDRLVAEALAANPQLAPGTAEIDSED
ncbi:MAG: lysophospholipid acyltransferase family protein [Alphaproteobacteria bacterium]